MIEIYTDGGCLGNPGPGGWAFVVNDGDTLGYSLSGGEKLTTNNKMELKAVISALEYALSINEENVTIITDSQYVKNGITLWIKNWKRNGWRTSGGGAVKNVELWNELDSLNQKLHVEWKWVKGHFGVKGNEECDRLVKIQSNLYSGV